MRTVKFCTLTEVIVRTQGTYAKKKDKAAWTKVVVKVYKKLNPETITNCYQSWPARVADLIANRGGPIRW